MQIKTTQTSINKHIATQQNRRTHNFFLFLSKSSKTHDSSYSILAVQACFEAYRTHLQCMASEEAFVPKHHLMVHLLHRSGYFGNPRFYSEWLDESLNKTLKSACRLTSQSTFENSVLTRMQSILSSNCQKRAKPS